MIEIDQLTKQYKTVTAVDSVSFYLEEGEIVGLLGPNGAGKSTAISMISTLLKPTSGKVYFKGENTTKNPKRLRSSLGVVPQELAIYEQMTAFENLLFFAKVYNIERSKLKPRVNEVLEIIGLTDRQREKVGHFSGGMKRRLNIGIALLHEPEFLIMDEPTVGIDPQSRNHILETVKKLNRELGMGVLYTSHYIEEVEFLCDRIYIMDHGKVIANGTKEELKSLLAQEETIVFVVDQLRDAFIEELEELEFVSKLVTEGQICTMFVPKGIKIFSQLFHIAEKHHIDIFSIDVKMPSLEDVFLHLTGKRLRD